MGIRAGIGVGLLLVCPTVVHAQMTAYALIPSWTQSRVLVNDAHTGKAIAAIPLTGEPYDVAVTPDGRRAYVTLRAQHRVAVIDLGTLQVVTKILVGSTPRGVAIAPEGKQAWITEAGSNTVTAIDIATNTVVSPSVAVGQMPWGIAITPGGDRAYVVNRTDSTVSAIDLAAHAVIAVMPVDQEPVEIIIAPDGGMAYVTSTIANTVVPIDLRTHTVRPSIPVGLFPRDLVITPDGKEIFVADSNADTISVIDTATLTVIDTIPTGANSIPSGATITPDAKHVLVSTQAGNTLILDAATHTILSTFPIGGQGLRLVSTPNLVVPNTKATLPIASDADFTALGFKNFVTFRGGRVQATSDWTTFRNLSLLTQGGIIETQSFSVDVAGSIVNDGTLQKRGSGTLTLSGASTHPATQVGDGTLAVTGTHAGSILLGLSATLAGTGTVGDIDATQGGATSPGLKGPGELHAANVQMGPQHSLIIELNGLTPGVDYDRLVVGGTAVLHDATLVLQPSVSFPPGSTFTIVTNAVSTFAGLPEGAVIATAFGNFRITYFGGPSLTDVVLTAL